MEFVIEFEILMAKTVNFNNQVKPDLKREQEKTKLEKEPRKAN